MKLFIIGIIICIIAAYAYCYFIFPDNISILQSSINTFDFNLLYKRQPLVIDDAIADIDSLLKLWFTPNIIQTDITIDSKTIWSLNCYKYCYIHALNDTEVMLCSATSKVTDDIADNNEPVIAIPIKTAQGIIIPYRWHYNIKNNTDVKLYGIHDYMTYILDILI